MLGYATITKPSLDDANRVFGPGKAPEAYIELFHEMGPKVVVFTMGTDGLLLSTEGNITHIPARPVEVVDATGAGDAFWGGFLVAVLDGRSLYEAVLFGREVAEIKLRTVGPIAGTLDREAIYREVAAGFIPSTNSGGRWLV